MKAFVYYKANSKKVIVLKDVREVKVSADVVTFMLEGGAELSFDKKVYKTTTYTN